MSGLLQVVYFLIPPFIASFATLLVWGKTASLGFALVAGTLSGVVMLFVVSLLFWSGTDICEQCHMTTSS